MAMVLSSVPAALHAASEPEIHSWVERESPLQAHLKPGEWTLVVFWSITCSICASEMPALNALHQAERGNGISMLGVSIDGEAFRGVVGEWMQQHQMEFPTLLGELGSVAGYFGAAAQEDFRGTPSFMLFNRSGKLAGMNAGPVRVQAIKDFIARKEGKN